MDCLTAMMDCAQKETLNVQLSTGLNLYDLRKPCAPGQQLCYDLTKETAFMNDPAIKRIMGAEPWRPWAQCNFTVSIPFLLSGDYFASYRQDVIKVLAAGARVLIYAGDADFQVDWMGCRLWMEHLPWAHQQEWLAAAQEVVFLGDQAKGVRQSAR